jgi:hypothetical protein
MGEKYVQELGEKYWGIIGIDGMLAFVPSFSGMHTEFDADLSLFIIIIFNLD